VTPSEAEDLVGAAEHRADVGLGQALGAQLAHEPHAGIGLDRVEAPSAPALERVLDRVPVGRSGARAQLDDGAGQPGLGRFAEAQPRRRGDPFALAAGAENRVAFGAGLLDPNAPERLPALPAVAVAIAELEIAAGPSVDVALQADAAGR
jgi:hypothetical protein